MLLSIFAFFFIHCTSKQVFPCAWPYFTSVSRLEINGNKHLWPVRKKKRNTFFSYTDQKCCFSVCAFPPHRLNIQRRLVSTLDLFGTGLNMLIAINHLVWQAEGHVFSPDLRMLNVLIATNRNVWPLWKKMNINGKLASLACIKKWHWKTLRPVVKPCVCQEAPLKYTGIEAILAETKTYCFPQSFFFAIFWCHVFVI